MKKYMKWLIYLDMVLVGIGLIVALCTAGFVGTLLGILGFALVFSVGLSIALLYAYLHGYAFGHGLEKAKSELGK